MSPAATRTVGRAVGKRLSGQKPGVIRALGGATVVGIAAAVLTYRLLRGE